MGKVVKAIAGVVGVVALVVPGVGTAISGAIFGALTGGAVGTLAAAAFTFSQMAVFGLTAIGLSTAVGFASKALGLGPKPVKMSSAAQDRLRANLDVRAFRKIVFGHTASAVDVRYQEFTGSEQDYLNSIIVLASHQLHSIEEAWFDEQKAWDSSGTIASDFAGYLAVTKREVGTAGNALTITGSSSWTAASSRMVGSAYLWLRYKLTGNSKKAESPFASSVTSRITVRVRGALLYDPRRDSTVPGGSGSHRADDQGTRAWVNDDVGRNPALQLLWFLLGWRINGKLAVGLGLPPERIDLESFIAAANLCDEPVTLAAGGTEPRYRADGVFSEGDDPSLVFDNLCVAMNGVLRDSGGKMVLEVLHNDLSDPDVVELTEADVIGDFTWLQTPPIDQDFNVVRGRYVDASDEGLYQMPDFPEVALDSYDGIDRPSPAFDLPMVQSAGQAQRLAKQYLQRAQYPGTFSADFLASAWRCVLGRPVRFTFPALGFEDKMFRVGEHTIRLDGTCPMVLREESVAIYAWDNDERAPVTAAGPVRYDPLNEPWVQAVGALDDLLDKSDEIAAMLIDWNDDNDGNGAIPPAATSVTLTGQNFNDSSGQTIVSWAYTTDTDPAAANNIDGFLVALLDRVSSAGYTYDPADNSSLRWDTVTPDRRAVAFAGVAVDRYCTGIVIPFRNVRAAVEADTVVQGPAAQSSAVSPYRQASSPNFNGLIAGDTAADVKDGAARSRVAITMSGYLGTGRLLTGSVATDALNKADWSPQGATIFFATSDAFGAGMLTLTINGTNLNCQFIFDHQITIMDPVTGEEPSFQVLITATNNATSVKYSSGTFTVSDVWNTDSASGLKYFPRDSIGIEYNFQGLPAGTYTIGYEIYTNSRCGMISRAYRYIRAEDKRAIS